ncbi:MAG: hypothetical protein QM779_11925 [Propionicimonas sp.]|uniref:fibronectin type III domain-containing protein n=1 Tax=Propionicimonas sp. TaxID=1955623 RepID=UPI003D1195A9
MLSVLATLLLLIGIGPSPVALADPVMSPPPSSLRVSQRSTMAAVTWPAVAGATGYAVDYDSDPTFAAAGRVTTSETVAVITGLSPDTTYFVRLASWDAATGAVGSWGASVSFTTGEPEYAVPAPVAALAAESSTSISASWAKVDGVAGEVRYQTAVGTELGNLTPGAVQKKRTATFDNLDRETKYYVSVRATDAAGTPVTAWSSPSVLETPESMPLRVGTYNILCSNCSKGKAPWSARRGPMVTAIRDQDMDVLGVQEASIGGIPGGGTQYMDLINRLGKPYKLTEYRRNVSPDNRIIYNSDRVTLVKQGVIRLPASKRYLAWAIFTQKSTGKKFLFTNTHLDPRNTRAGRAADKAQSRAIVAAIARLKHGLPVIAVGDYASTKWENGGNAAYDIMQAGGYKDPLGNAARSRGSAPGAFVENRIHTSYASLNMYKRKARNFPGSVNGSNTDYIFVSPMRVSEYEVVVKIDSSGNFIGVIPSDHNLLRATVYLP